MAGIGVVLVLCLGVLAIVVTRRTPAPSDDTTTTTEEQASATVPTPEDASDPREVLWRAELGGPLGHRIATYGGLTIAAVGGSRLVAIDEAGQEAWQTRLSAPIGQASFGVVAGGDVVVTRSVGTIDDTIEAHAAEDGSPLWTATLPTAGYIDPQLTIVGDLVVANGYDRIVAFDRTTGDEEWSTSGSGVLSGLAVADGEVFSVDEDPTGETWLVALDLNDGAEVRREVLGIGRLDTRWPLLAGDTEGVITLDQGEWARAFRPVDLATNQPSTSGAITLGLDLQGVPLRVVDDTLLVASAETYTLLAFSLATGELRWASSHTVFELSDIDGTLVGRGLDLIEIDPTNGGATILATDLGQVGGPVAGIDGGVLVVPDESGLVAYG